MKRNGSQKAVGMQQLVYNQKSGSTSFIFHKTKAKHFIYHWWKFSFNVLIFPHNIMRGQKKKMTRFHDSNTCKEYKYVS